MSEYEPPVRLTFNNHKEAGNLIDDLEQAKEDVRWEQRVQEDGTVVVLILAIVNHEEEDIEGEQ